MKTYRVKDWAIHFENAESRKYKSLRWVPIPNKHDGGSYRQLVAHPKSVQVFCAWILIIEVASKTPTRGVLTNGSRPLTASDLHLKTGFPKAIFEIALEVLVSEEIGWLEEIGPKPQQKDQSPEISGDAGKNPVNRIEENRTDLNRKRDAPSGFVDFGIDGSACVPEKLNTPEFKESWKMWLEHLKQKRKPATLHAQDLQLAKLSKMEIGVAIKTVKHCIEKNWQGIYEDTTGTNAGNNRPTTGADQRQLGIPDRTIDAAAVLEKRAAAKRLAESQNRNGGSTGGSTHG